MSESNAELFRQTARVIDEIDGEIKLLNESKRDTYSEIKTRITPAEFAALKEAIKLRRKRLVDKDACERHDELVWAVLNALEASDKPETAETVSTVTASPGNGIVAEQAPTRAHLHVHEETPHDPDTGEIYETPSAPHGAADAGGVPARQTLPESVGARDASADPSDPGEIPAFLRRVA